MNEQSIFKGLRYKMVVNVRIAVILILLVSWVASVSAQTGVELIVRPWPQDSQAQLDTGAMLMNRGHTDNADARFRMQRYNASGRWRHDSGNGQADFNIGFDATYLNLSTTDPVLPQRLVDQSVATGIRLNTANAQDSLWLVLGVGYAGNNPFADGDAVYGQASLVYNQPTSKTSGVQMILSYDGNRSILPDIPLPAVAYWQRASDSLSYMIGLPVNSIEWKPDKRWTIRAVYLVPVTFNAHVEYDLGKGWSLFGEYSDTTEAFTIDGGLDNRRLFFEQSRLEVGLQLRADQRVDVTLAAGYAFGQEFRQGFDVRNLDDVAEVTDEPYFRVAVVLRF